MGGLLLLCRTTVLMVAIKNVNKDALVESIPISLLFLKELGSCCKHLVYIPSNVHKFRLMTKVRKG